MVDIWPFNMGASEGWAVIYLLMSLVVTIVTYQICRAVGRSFDRQRTGDQDTHSRLTVGRMPQPDEWMAIAYLRGGTTGVAETLVGAAISEGSLVFDPPRNRFQLGTGANRPDPLMAQFIAAVAHTPLTPSSVRTAAMTVANSAKPALEQEIRALGLVRPASLRGLLVVMTLVGGAVCVLIGLLRISTRAAVSHGDAPTPSSC